LYDLHAEQGGTFSPWRGQEIASHYESILDEHASANDALALFDLGYRSFIRLEGLDASRLLNRLATMDVDGMPTSALCELPLVYPDGTLAELVKLSREKDKAWLMIFENRDAAKVLTWFRQEAEGCECWIDDISQQYAWIGLSGARAMDYLSCSAPTLTNLKPFSMTEALVSGVAARIWRVEDNFFEIACQPELLAKIIRAWWSGSEHPVLCGWASYENWRLEHGELRDGFELKEGVTPFELGLDDKVDFEHAQLKHMLIHFTLAAMRLPRVQSPIFCAGKMVGFVCGGGFSVKLRCPIGSAWVNTDDVDFDQLEVEIRRQRFPLIVRKAPFA
jgi:glycine cleavage system aminomethyltransferase T